MKAVRLRTDKVAAPGAEQAITGAAKGRVYANTGRPLTLPCRLASPRKEAEASDLEVRNGVIRRRAHTGHERRSNVEDNPDHRRKDNHAEPS